MHRACSIYIYPATDVVTYATAFTFLFHTLDVMLSIHISSGTTKSKGLRIFTTTGFSDFILSFGGGFEMASG
jgi:hypothetical protein